MATVEVVDMDDGVQLPPGLSLLTDFITEEEERILVDNIDKSEWKTEIARRTQQYGYHYCYRLRGVDELDDQGQPMTPPIPQYLQFLVDRLAATPQIPVGMDQIIINEYEPGQQIKPHIDSTKDWDACVVSLSCLSDWRMVFIPEDDDKSKEVSMVLPKRSLLVLKGDARYKWKHGIRSQVKVGRRVSLTFRHYIGSGGNS
ncbi:hypothetical protein SAMD00019534_100830 [Acytostelium subglobosum LB1]|uniref:hypothetical protein n=1 Tax=Acytostelium subglobosum LB1 TaxID=1410327 RepID=UPI0006450095|nr:hypothetical protein SAMD00019534_100830 [Acytostelium subglobosum LB1]GAM26908.1 hypothetical protein SAMD00019534_100830 [Acytostelium subglobosum LB1]|eukprot:XP_012750176.1 hypothetical protein SAMD00019534_100830 [Acytostelium subglobosum LB1]